MSSATSVLSCRTVETTSVLPRVGKVFDADARQDRAIDLLVGGHDRERRFAPDQQELLLRQHFVDDVDDFGDGVLARLAVDLRRDERERARSACDGDDGHAGLIAEPFEHFGPALVAELEADRFRRPAVWRPSPIGGSGAQAPVVRRGGVCGAAERPAAVPTSTTRRSTIAWCMLLCSFASPAEGRRTESAPSADRHDTPTHRGARGAQLASSDNRRLSAQPFGSHEDRCQSDRDSVKFLIFALIAALPRHAGCFPFSTLWSAARCPFRAAVSLSFCPAPSLCPSLLRRRRRR